MIGILLISHGPLAQGLKETYCFFNDESALPIFFWMFYVYRRRMIRQIFMKNYP